MQRTQDGPWPPRSAGELVSAHRREVKEALQHLVLYGRLYAAVPDRVPLNLVVHELCERNVEVGRVVVSKTLSDSSPPVVRYLSPQATRQVLSSDEELATWREGLSRFSSITALPGRRPRGERQVATRYLDDVDYASTLR